METLAILLLLFALNSEQGNLKRTLSDLLSFYRENREIIQLIAGNFRGNDAAHAQEKSRPQSEVGNADILREFLERRSI